MQLPQPNLGVRTNALIDTPFLMKTAETIRLGTGIPQIFNDEVVVPAFLNRGVSLEDARDYSVVGCVELSIPGRTYGLHDIAMFNLLKVMEICLHENEGNATLTYEGLLEQIRAKISHYITLMVEGSNICDIGHRDWAPVPLLSSFISDCLEKGRDITDGGARYNFSGVQGIGIANLSDSLHALKGMVFDQQRLSFDELLSVLKANFATPEGEKVRARLINRFEKYGNDIDEVDNISAELLRHYCKEVEKYQNPRGGYFTPGSYTVSAHVPLGSVVGATPDGRFAGEQLADGGLSPMLGQDGQRLLKSPCCLTVHWMKSPSRHGRLRKANGGKVSHYCKEVKIPEPARRLSRRDRIPFLPTSVLFCRGTTNGGLSPMLLNQRRYGEKVRARLINRFEKYGNDIDEVDNISAELLRHYCKEVEKYQNPRGGYFTPGSYTVSAHVPLGSVVGATPDGRFAGEQLADGGLSPMLGQDAQGPTAVLKSVSKLDNTLLSNGTLLNVKFTPATLEGEAGLRKLADFLRAFTQLKLQHIQFNVVNADTLREAQQRPQDYAGLVVRVAGYSEVMKDDIFFRTSGGGVTLSGGEVLMQAEFATRFLQRLRLWGVSCAIETAGDAPASKLLPLAKLCDEVLFDLKIMDATQARDVVKMNLPRVLENLRLLVSEGVNVIPRLPLIPGFTLSRENMQQALDVLIPLNIRQIHLLPFHQYGEPKYRLLGKTWSMKEVSAPSSADVATMREMAERAGFQVTVGG